MTLGQGALLASIGDWLFSQGTRAGARTLLVVLLAGCSSSSCDRPILDDDLCPRDRPESRSTVLLLDTSDPLSVKHEEELARLVRELQAPTANANDFRVAPGEALIVYELNQNLRELQPSFRVCNPGDQPDGWEDELTRGKQVSLRRWRQFTEAVAPLFEGTTNQVEQAQSLVLETLGVIVPRHARSSRSRQATDEESRTHVILFSDLLQHSEPLSHYGPYPNPDQLVNTDGLRALSTDLKGVDVSLYRLERPLPAGRWQTRDHYYWWTELIEAFGGTVVYQDSI